jgi:hypothetical protein
VATAVPSGGVAMAAGCYVIMFLKKFCSSNVIGHTDENWRLNSAPCAIGKHESVPRALALNCSGETAA